MKEMTDDENAACVEIIESKIIKSVNAGGTADASHIRPGIRKYSGTFCFTMGSGEYRAAR